MISDFEDDEGYYQGKYLPARLAKRAARVTDDPLQLSLSSYRSPEALTLCRMARTDLISLREIHARVLMDNARKHAAQQTGLTHGR
jgi:hypothetical protein